MHLYKKVLIVVLTFAFVASMGAAAVSAQTSATASTPAVGATYKTPTTFTLIPSAQSVKLNTKTQSITGVLRKGASGLSSQTVWAYVKFGSGPWQRAGLPFKTGIGTKAGVVTLHPFSTTTQTVLYELVFPGTSTLAPATSNVVAIKFENTKTKPYQTAVWAYAPKQVVKHGTTATMWVKLQSGATPLTGKVVYVWKWSGGKWVIVGKTTTRTAPAGWVPVPEKLTSAGTRYYKFTFPGSPPYGPSTSNLVQLIWT